MRKILLVLVVAISSLATKGQQHEVVLTPYLDCFIHNVEGESSSQREFNGTKKYLLVSSPKTTSNSDETENRTILSFGKYEFAIDDLISAELKLFYRSGYGTHTGDNDFNVHWYGDLTDTNYETGINWYNAPETDFSLSYLSFEGTGESEDDISIDVTTLLKFYYDSEKHIGLCLKLASARWYEEQQLVFASKEYSEESKHPQLVLTLKGEATPVTTITDNSHLSLETLGRSKYRIPVKEEKLNLNVYSTSGSIVLQDQNYDGNIIDLSGFTDGIYLIQVKKGATNKCFKVVKL